MPEKEGRDKALELADESPPGGGGGGGHGVPGEGGNAIGAVKSTGA